jgi:hypothetical protein
VFLTGIYFQRTVKGLSTTFTPTRRHERSCRVILNFWANLLFGQRTAHVGIRSPLSSSTCEYKYWNRGSAIDIRDATSYCTYQADRIAALTGDFVAFAGYPVALQVHSPCGEDDAHCLRAYAIQYMRCVGGSDTRVRTWIEPIGERGFVNEVSK